MLKLLAEVVVPIHLTTGRPLQEPRNGNITGAVAENSANWLNSPYQDRMPLSVGSSGIGKSFMANTIFPRVVFFPAKMETNEINFSLTEPALVRT